MEGQRYKDRVTIVTGGSGGIGYGVVKTFVTHGSRVMFCDVKEEKGKEVENELNVLGPGECMFLPCDTTNEEQIKNLIDVTFKKYGRIDCLINNAGSHPPHKPIDDFSSEDMRSLFDLNVMGFYNTSKYALPHLRKTQGNIVNNCSLVADIGQRWAVTYASTKGAILSMTKALAVDEATYGVRVNCFSPSNIFTPLWEKAAIASDDYDKTISAGKNAQVLGRFGTIEECGLVCLFLAADATFCTGTNIYVTGGSELNYGHKSQLVEQE